MKGLKPRSSDNITDKSQTRDGLWQCCSPRQWGIFKSWCKSSILLGWPQICVWGRLQREGAMSHLLFWGEQRSLIWGGYGSQRYISSLITWITIYNYILISPGCEVYAHDHTVKKFPSTKHKNIHFFKIGIGASNTRVTKGKIKTLDTLLRDNAHTDRFINYLKVCC